MTRKEYKWYIWIVVIAIFIFSLLCWKQVTGKTEKTTETITTLEILDRRIDEFEDKWNSSIFKKELLSKVDSIYTYITTGQISSTLVVKGKDKWLFLKSKGDSDSIADYEGTNTYSDEEMDRMLMGCLNVQENLKNRGIQLVFLINPNKEIVYSKYMPVIYKKAKYTRTDKLIKYLSDNGVNILSSKKELIERSQTPQLYYYYDTHWNQLGAYIGARKALSGFGIEIPPLSDRQWTQYELSNRDHYCADRDLARIAGLARVLDDETEYIVDGTEPMNWIDFKEEQEGGEMSVFYNPKANNPSVLLLVGDSFRTSMVPVLRETFKYVFVVKDSTYTPQMLDEIKPDYMIIEYVERYSSDLLEIEKYIGQ